MSLCPEPPTPARYKWPPHPEHTVQTPKQDACSPTSRTPARFWGPPPHPAPPSHSPSAMQRRASHGCPSGMIPKTPAMGAAGLGVLVFSQSTHQGTCWTPLQPPKGVLPLQPSAGLRLAQLVSPRPRYSHLGANTEERWGSGCSVQPNGVGGSLWSPPPLCKLRAAPLLSGTIWGVFPPAPPANPQAGNPQAPPPFSHAPFLNGAPQPTGHPGGPQERDGTPKICVHAWVTPRHQASPGTHTPHPAGPPRPGSQAAHWDGSGETQAKNSPALGLRWLFSFPGRLLR